MQYNKII